MIENWWDWLFNILARKPKPPRPHPQTISGQLLTTTTRAGTLKQLSPLHSTNFPYRIPITLG